MNLTKILSKLVSFPVFGGKSNLTIIGWIKKYIESFGIEAVLVKNKEGSKASLHCKIGPSKNGGVILSGHTDVIPVEGQNWDTDPFVLTDKKDGKLYGRGSCDMKGFLACCLSVIPKLVKADLKHPIYFAFSYDEEIGCIAAPELIANLQNYYSENPKYAIIGEPSLMQPIIAHKGICLYTTTVNGSAGHSSRILEEVNAIHESARLILWLEDKMKKFANSKNIDKKFTPPHTSLNTGVIKGGIAANVIADKAFFSWDARVIPNDKISDIISEFEEHCRKREIELKNTFADFKIETSALHSPVPPLNTQKDQDIVKLIKKINSNTNLGTVSYTSEAGQFKEAGIESIICGPGSIDQAHKENEFIKKSELEKCILFLEKLIIEFSQ